MNLWRSVRGLLVGGVFVTPLIAFAQGILPTIVPPNCQGAEAATKCGICDLATLAQNLLNGAIYIMIFLSAVMFAWAGWKAVSSGGNSAEYTAAKRIFGEVIIGLVIMLVAWLVIDTVMKTLVDQGGSFGPWNKICR